MKSKISGFSAFRVSRFRLRVAGLSYKMTVSNPHFSA